MGDPCVQVCNELGATVGPVALQLGATILGFALVWWRSRKDVKGAVAVANVATAQAEKAKVAAREAQVQLAEIKGSLRPVTITGTGQSGLYEPVALPPPPPTPAQIAQLGGKPNG